MMHLYYKQNFRTFSPQIISDKIWPTIVMQAQLGDHNKVYYHEYMCMNKNNWRD